MMMARVEAAAEAALSSLRRSGKLRDVRLAPPQMPRPFARVLERVLALETDGPRRTAIEAHYLDLMPKMRVEQLATTDAPAATFFAAPLDWSRLPRLSSAIARLQALLADCGAPPVDTSGETLADFYQHTFYGAYMPLLYGAPADLAHFSRATGSRDEILDRYFAAPLIHELTHLQRARDVFPLYLDECVAGWLGVTVLRSFAYPDPSFDDGLYAAPWFAQVGQALARVAGPRNLLRAHAGVEPWSSALPAGLADALARLGWEDYVESRRMHFLSDNFHPDPWLKVIFLAAAAQPLQAHTLSSLRALPWSEVPPGDPSPLDTEIVTDALSAMCLHNFQTQLSFRVISRPPPQPILVEPRHCRITTPGGAHDPVPLSYLLPPAVAARLPGPFTVELADLAAIPQVAQAIIAGRPDHAS